MLKLAGLTYVGKHTKFNADDINNLTVQLTNLIYLYGGCQT